MSATLEAQALSAFYSGAPVIEVPGRLFPVTTRSPAQYLVDDVATLVAEGRNVLVFQPGKAEIEATIAELLRRDVSAEILPLHGELTAAEQKKCFAHYGRQKVVVSTNVAQTSVTIDDIDAVVDSGMERRVELMNGVEGLYLRSISMADSKQRAGRAGRTKPGVYIDHCGTHDRRNFPVAEIERVRLDQTVLRLAMAGFDMEKLRFFHQPDTAVIYQARETLVKLGCMTADGRVTQIGKQVSRLPVSVQYGRMIVEAIRLGVMSDVVLAAAILENGEINTRKDKDGFPSTVWRNHIGAEQRQSDVLAQMQLYRAAEQMHPEERFDEGIHPKAFRRVKDLCKQIGSSLESRGVKMTSTGRCEDIVLAICAGMVDHLYTINYGSLTNGQYRERNRESVVMLPSAGFAVGLPFDLEIKTRRGSMVLSLVRMLTLVTSDQLMKVAPQLVEEKKGLNPRLDADGKVVSTTETWFNGHKVTEVTVYDDRHPEANALLTEYVYSNFQYPSRERMDITEEMQVPDVVEVVVGTHPRTGEQLLAYGYYQKEYWDQLAGKWTRDREEAERVNAETISQVQTVIERQKQERAAAEVEKVRREAEVKSQIEVEAERTCQEDFQIALENAEWKVDVAKSESNRYHGDGVLIAKDGSIIEPDGELRNKGSAFVSRCYISVPDGVLAISWSWDNRNSSVQCAEFTIAFELESVSEAQIAAMAKIEKEKGLCPQALAKLFQKKVKQQSFIATQSSGGVSKASLSALRAKFGR
ncbi:MAG: hypothetical protein QG614_31 [Patescibacteria group bacterium]|nr:hypothetical protein [Patescibacteria group bacterium]